MPGVSGAGVGTSSVAVAVGDGVAVGSSVDVGSSVEVGGGKVGGSGGVGEGPGVKGGGTSVGGTGKVGGGGGVSGVAVAPGIGVGRGTSALLPQSGSTPTLSAPRTAPPVDGTAYTFRFRGNDVVAVEPRTGGPGYYPMYADGIRGVPAVRSLERFVTPTILPW